MELETSKHHMEEGLKYLKLAKPGWLEILKNIIEALSHVHKVGHSS